MSPSPRRSPSPTRHPPCPRASLYTLDRRALSLGRRAVRVVVVRVRVVPRVGDVLVQALLEPRAAVAGARRPRVPQPAMLGASSAPICITSPAPRPPISSSELMPIVASRAAESASVAATPHTSPFSEAHASHGPQTVGSRRRACCGARRRSSRRARVSITFTRRGSAKNPTLPFAFARVHEHDHLFFPTLEPAHRAHSSASIESGAEARVESCPAVRLVAV